MDSHSIRIFQADRVRPPASAAIWMRPAPFSFETPIDLEIGSGVGWWALRYARQNPNRYLIAIEKTREKFARFDQRVLAHTQIQNLTAVNADAIAWITHCLGTQKLSRVFILYPNPNPKNTAQRWIRMPFFGALLERLKPGGEIFWATNISDYAEEIRQYSKSVWKLEPFLDRSFTQQTRPSDYPRTHFEKKYLLRGETCWELGYRKPCF